MTADQPQPPQALDYATPPARRSSRRLMVLLFLAFGGVVAIVLLRTERENPPWTNSTVYCAFNLRQIGDLLLAYASEPEHAGRFPDSLDPIVGRAYDTNVFICPASKDTPPGGATAEEKAQALRAGGHCTYIYVGRGITAQAPPDTPIAYEPLTNHNRTSSRGMNVLFADGHVEWIHADQAAAILARAATQPTTAPTTAEAQ